MKVESGGHTFSLTAKSSYTEIQNIVGNVSCVSKADKYHLNITHQIVAHKAIGVEIHLYQSLVHSSWIKLIVNPSSLLAGNYCPTELFNNPKKIPDVKKTLRKVLDQCGIDRRLKEFKLSRCDLTSNLYCDSVKEVMERLDIFRRSYVMPRYKEKSDLQSWTISCKSCEFSAYNKTYELKKRHDVSIDDHILRLELRMGRKRIRQVTKKSDWEGQLEGLFEESGEHLDNYLHRLHQDFGPSVSLENALDIIDKSTFRKKTKRKLRKIVKLSTRSSSLVCVQKKMRISCKEFGRLLNRFYRLEISPIPKGD